MYTVKFYPVNILLLYINLFNYYTDSDGGVKSYSLQTVLVTYYAVIHIPACHFPPSLDFGRSRNWGFQNRAINITIY